MYGFRRHQAPVCLNPMRGRLLASKKGGRRPIGPHCLCRLRGWRAWQLLLELLSSGVCTPCGPLCILLTLVACMQDWAWGRERGAVQNDLQRVRVPLAPACTTHKLERQNPLQVWQLQCMTRTSSFCMPCRATLHLSAGVAVQ